MRSFAMAMAVGLTFVLVSCTTVHPPAPLKPPTTDSQDSSKPTPTLYRGDITAPHSNAYFHYLSGLVAEREGAYEEALRFFEQAANDDESLTQAHERSAALLLRMGRIERALEHARRGLESDSNYVPLLLTVGAIYSSIEKSEEAIPYFDRVIKMEPERSEVWTYLTVAYFQSGRNAEALELLARYTKKFPDDPLGTYYTGKAQGRLKQWKKAEATFRGMISSYPGFSQGHEGLAAVFRAQGLLQEAIEVYENYIKTFPHDELFRRKLADTYLQQKSYDKAIGQLEELVGQESVDLDLRFKLGITHLRQAEATGDTTEYEKALSQLQLVRQKYPSSHQTLYYIASIFEQLNMPHKAIEVWEELLKLGDKISGRDVLLKLAELYEETDNMEKSLDYVNIALERFPSDADIHYFAGLLLNRLERYEDAIVEFGRAIKISPASGHYYFYQGVVYEKLEEYEKCIAAMTKVLELNANHADALNYLGYLYADLNRNLPDSERYLVKATSLQPDNGYFLDSLGWLYYRQGRYNEALEVTLKSVRSLPPDPTVLEHLGDIYSAIGSRHEAIDAYTRSLEANTEKSDTEKRAKVEKKLAELTGEPAPEEK